MKIGYARVSRLDQDHTSQSSALAAAGCEKIFTEKASGAKRDRPELAKALDFLRKGDSLVVWKLDRLARSTLQLAETAEDLKRRGIDLQVLTQGIDTSTPTGKLLYDILGGIAEFERSLIRERTMAGLAEARNKGKLGGRPPRLKAEDLKAARAMLKDPDITVTEIAKRLNVAPSTLYRHIPHARAAATIDNDETV